MSSEAKLGNVLISLKGVGKWYPPKVQPVRRLVQELLGNQPLTEAGHWALQGVDMDIRQGESIGIIGRNGAGKSTLLQIISQVLAPSSGHILVKGRVAALLELGAGLSPDMTGLENIRLYGSVLGLSTRTLNEQTQSIIQFADIGDYIYKPVGTYSSGMFVRLAFAIATASVPDVLIVDEALSVGDGAFARKSFDRIMALKEQGVVLIFCSHTMYHIHALCEKALWLQDGKVMRFGRSDEVTSAYESTLFARLIETATPIATVDCELNSNPAEVSTTVASNGVAYNGSNGAHEPPRIRAMVFGTTQGPVSGVAYLTSQEDTLTLDCEVWVPSSRASPTLAFVVVHSSGVEVTSGSNLASHCVVPVQKNGLCLYRLRMEKIALLQGSYRMDVHLMCERGLLVYESVEGAIKLEIRQNSLHRGLCYLDQKWSVM